MSYKVFLFDALSPVEWSQVAWKLEGQTVSTDDCRIEFIHDVLLANLPHDGMILDAGCGVARWPIYLRRRGFRVFGIEYSHDACRIATANDPGLQVVRADVRRKPLRDASVDAVLSLGVVEHDEAARLATADAQGVLRLLAREFFTREEGVGRRRFAEIQHRSQRRARADATRRDLHRRADEGGRL